MLPVRTRRLVFSCMRAPFDLCRGCARRAEPRQLSLISKGGVDLKALRLVGSELEAAAYVAPSDRYAVVPQASGQNGSAAVPQVCLLLA